MWKMTQQHCSSVQIRRTLTGVVMVVLSKPCMQHHTDRIASSTEASTSTAGRLSFLQVHHEQAHFGVEVMGFVLMSKHP